MKASASSSSTAASASRCSATDLRYRGAPAAGRTGTAAPAAAWTGGATVGARVCGKAPPRAGNVIPDGTTAGTATTCVDGADPALTGIGIGIAVGGARVSRAAPARLGAGTLSAGADTGGSRAAARAISFGAITGDGAAIGDAVGADTGNAIVARRVCEYNAEAGVGVPRSPGRKACPPAALDTTFGGVASSGADESCDAGSGTRVERTGLRPASVAPGTAVIAPGKSRYE